MPADARWSSAPTPAGPSSPPVVDIHQPPGNLHQQTPLLIMVLLQTLLIALIGWRALTPTGGANSAHGDPAATDDSLRRWLAAERSQVKQEAQAELMDRVLGELAAAPDGAFHQLAELQEHNDELKGSLRAQQARERELVAEQASRAKQAERDQQSLQAKLADLTNQQTRLREQLDESNGKLAKVSARLKALAPDSDDSTGDEAGTLPWYRSPLTISGGAVVVVAALAAGWWSQQRRTRAADGAR